MLFESFHLLFSCSICSGRVSHTHFLLRLHSLWKFRSFPCHIYFLAKFYCCSPSLLLLISTLFSQFVVTFVDNPLLPHCFSVITEDVFVCLCYCLVVLTMWNIFLGLFLRLFIIHVVVLSVMPAKPCTLLLIIISLLLFLHSSQSFFFF